jgi:hypothetical protein
VSILRMVREVSVEQRRVGENEGDAPRALLRYFTRSLVQHRLEADDGGGDVTAVMEELDSVASSDRVFGFEDDNLAGEGRGERDEVCGRTKDRSDAIRREKVQLREERKWGGRRT